MMGCECCELGPPGPLDCRGCAPLHPANWILRIKVPKSTHLLGGLRGCEMNREGNVAPDAERLLCGRSGLKLFRSGSVRD